MDKLISVNNSSTTTKVVDITAANFEAEVISRSKTQIVVIDFWASWCDPCKKLTPILTELAEKAAGVWILAKIDIDANPALAQVFRVQSVPTVVAMVQGQPVAAFPGLQSKAYIEQWLTQVRQIVTTKFPTMAKELFKNDKNELLEAKVTELQNALNSKDFKLTESLAQEILKLDNNNEIAIKATKFVDLSNKIANYEINFTEIMNDRSTWVDLDDSTKLMLVDYLVVNQELTVGFELLLAGIKKYLEIKPEIADKYRTKLIELFDLFPRDTAAVKSARRQLAILLY